MDKFTIKLNKRGFTLIELLAVIVILAIVLVVTIPSVINSMSSAKNGQLKNATKVLSDWLTKQNDILDLGLDMGIDSTYSNFISAYGNFENSYVDAVENNKPLSLCSSESYAMLAASGISLPEDNIDIENSYIWKDDKKIEASLSAKEGGVFYVPDGTNNSYSDDSIANLSEFKIYGNTIQNGTPSQSIPVEIKSVGDLVTDSSDSHYGKYKISIIARDGSYEKVNNIYLNEPLRKIAGIADYIDFKNGKVIRKIAEKVLTGSETWEVISSETSSSYFRTPVGTYDVVYSNNGLCTHFAKGTITTTTTTIGFHILRIKNPSKTYIAIRPENAASETITSFKAYLTAQYNNKTPVIVDYVLANPIEETVSSSLPLVAKNTITYEVNTEITPSNIIIQYEEN